MRISLTRAVRASVQALRSADEGEATQRRTRAFATGHAERWPASGSGRSDSQRGRRRSRVGLPGWESGCAVGWVVPVGMVRLLLIYAAMPPRVGAGFRGGGKHHTIRGRFNGESSCGSHRSPARPLAGTCSTRAEQPGVRSNCSQFSRERPNARTSTIPSLPPPVPTLAPVRERTRRSARRVPPGPPVVSAAVHGPNRGPFYPPRLVA